MDSKEQQMEHMWNERNKNFADKHEQINRLWNEFEQFNYFGMSLRDIAIAERASDKLLSELTGRKSHDLRGIVHASRSE